MFKCVLKRSFSNISNTTISSIVNNKLNNNLNNLIKKNINVSLPILNMNNNEVNRELKSLQKEFTNVISSNNKLNNNLYDVVDNNLKDFYLNLYKSIKFIDTVENYTNTSEDHRKFINNILYYILNKKSKLFRPYVSLLFYYSVLSPGNVDSHFKEEELRKIIELCRAYELVHTGSLIHDDIIDDSDFRRSNKSLHLIFGNKTSILMGDYLLSKSSMIITKLNNLPLICKLSQTLEDLINGELFKFTIDESMCDNYLEKIYLKTASLISNNISSIPVLLNKSELDELFYLIGIHIGLSFQICDDLLDYNSNLNNLGKPTLNDLKSGLVTLPLIHSIYDGPSMTKNDLKDNKLVDLLVKKDIVNNDNNDKSDTINDIISIMNETNYYNKCKLAIYYHLYEIILLFKKHNIQNYSPLFNYVYNIVNRN